MASSSDAAKSDDGAGSLIKNGEQGNRGKLTKQNTDDTVKSAIRDNFRGPEWTPVRLTQTYLEVDGKSYSLVDIQGRPERKGLHR